MHDVYAFHINFSSLTNVEELELTESFQTTQKNKNTTMNTTETERLNRSKNMIRIYVRTYVNEWIVIRISVLFIHNMFTYSLLLTVMSLFGSTNGFAGFAIVSSNQKRERKEKRKENINRRNTLSFVYIYHSYVQALIVKKQTTRTTTYNNK